MPYSVKLSPKALTAKGALMAFYKPLLAKDTKINFNPILEDVTARNFKARLPVIKGALHIATRGKLAMDANMEDLSELLEALEQEKGEDLEPNSGMPMGPSHEEEHDPHEKVLEFLKDKISPDHYDWVHDELSMEHTESEAPLGSVVGQMMRRQEADDKRKADDARKRLGRDETEEEREEREKEEGEDARCVRDMRRARDAFRRAADAYKRHADDRRRDDADDKRDDDADDRRRDDADDRRRDADDRRRDDADDKRRDDADDRRRDDADDRRHRAADRRRARDKRRAEDDPPDFEGSPKTGADPAMDAALVDSKIARAIAETRAEARAVREAEKLVRPLVGELSMAMDTAEDVYRAALKMAGVPTKDVHPSAFPALVNMALQSRKDAPRTQRLGYDSAGAKSFEEMFPASKNITVQ